MGIYKSKIKEVGSVAFPEFQGDRIYMQEFYKDRALPLSLARWEGVLESMLECVDTDGPMYAMIDEKFVPAGTLHRRGGLHIDGYWNPGVQAHGAPWRPSHRPAPPSHTWRPSHRSMRVGAWGTGCNWGHSSFSEPEDVILASSVSACRGFVGEYSGIIGEGGDCSQMDTSMLQVVPMEAGKVYSVNVTGLHETVPVQQDCYRSVVRINVPGWTANKGE